MCGKPSRDNRSPLEAEAKALYFGAGRGVERRTRPVLVASAAHDEDVNDQVKKTGQTIVLEVHDSFGRGSVHLGDVHRLDGGSHGGITTIMFFRLISSEVFL